MFLTHEVHRTQQGTLMQYLGGKSRIAKQLAAEIDKVRKPGEWIWEPFCGGLSMTVALSKNGPVWATDANPALIALYQAVRDGWDPPTDVSRETYRAAKALPDSDPMKAFCGFGCSFGGKWFGGWGCPSKHHPTGLAVYARNVLPAQCAAPQALGWADFLIETPRPTPMSIYCDPPYAGTTSYQGVAPFDSATFVRQCVGWSRFTDVWVSEYEMPVGQLVFECASKTKVNGGVSGKALDATERLYYIAKGSLP